MCSPSSRQNLGIFTSADLDFVVSCRVVTGPVGLPERMKTQIWLWSAVGHGTNRFTYLVSVELATWWTGRGPGRKTMKDHVVFLELLPRILG